MDKGYYDNYWLETIEELKTVAIHNKNGQGLLPESVKTLQAAFTGRNPQ